MLSLDSCAFVSCGDFGMELVCVRMFEQEGEGRREGDVERCRRLD